MHASLASRWPAAIRSAELMRGALVRCGPGVRPIGWPEMPRTRLAALSPWLGDGRYIATHRTAAWVWGAARDPGAPLSACVPPGSWHAAQQGSAVVRVGECALFPADLAVFGMLIGQLGRRVRAAVAAALTLAALAQLGFGLGNGFGSAPSGFGSAPAALGFALTLLGVGLVAAGCAPRLVRRLRWEGLREQAVRWDTVSALAITGDSRAATARLGAPVRVGRRWRWRPSGRAIVSRDLLGIARTPARTLSAAAVLLVCGAVLEWAILAGSAAFPSGPQPAFAIGAAVGVAVQAGIAPLCRGLRSAAESAGAAPLLPLSPGALLRRHLVVPGALSAALLACGMLLAVLLTMTGSVDPGGAGVELGEVITACLAAVAFALAGLALRLLAALKGPLPQRLLAPIPTEVGDLAGMSVFLWTFDGPILAVLVGGAIGMLWIPGAGAVPAAPLGALVPAAGTLAVLAVLALWARARLAAARG